MSQSFNSQSEISSSNDNGGVSCDCNRPAKVVRSWTRDNPRRRFWICTGCHVVNGWDSCNFFCWRDVEKPEMAASCIVGS
ncbi:hypothetical protein N665_0096s0003 [Sinapis alba]|nr:hypothetical protein N665_0096s0003 [Sinapis alba]